MQTSCARGLKIGKPKYTCFYRRLSTIMFDKKKHLNFPIKTIFLATRITVVHFTMFSKDWI
jgi:hypothetical protein